MAEKISVQIALEGGAEIQRQLADIGKAGQDAFNNIAKSAGKVGTFQNFNPEEITARLKKMGVEGAAEINKIQAAVQAAVRLEKVAKGVAAVETAFGRLGTVGARAFSSLGSAANKLGASLSRSLGPLAGAARALGPVGLAAGGVTAGGVALVKFASSAEDAFKALRELQKASGESIENLSALGNAFARGGTPVKDFAAAFTNLSQLVTEASRTMADDIEQSAQRIEQAHQSAAQAASSLESAELNLQKIQLARREERTGRIDPAARRRIAIAERTLQLEQAEQRVAAARLALQQAQHQVRVAEANDLAKNIQLYQQMGQGAKVAFDPLTTQATKNQALLAALAKAGNNWKSVLANILQNASELERIQIGKALGLSPEMIQTLSAGSAALEAAAQKARQLGIALDLLDQKNLQRLIDSQNEAEALFDALKQKMGALVAPAIASFWEGFTARLRQLIPVFTQIGTLIGQMDFSKLGAAAADFLASLAKIAAGWLAILSGQVNFSDVLSQALQQAGQLLVSLAVQIGVSIGQGIIQGIISSIQAGIGSVVDLIKRALGGAGAGGPAAPAGAGGGMARGGLLGGRGTGTSDSNLAWVSRGEHIMPARAVSQPGVLAFLEALRRSGGNLRGVLDGMGQFALGGLVPRPAMAFAGGGMVGGANLGTLTLGLPSGGSVSVRASTSVVETLRKEAALAQVRSGGRKPSRYS